MPSHSLLASLAVPLEFLIGVGAAVVATFGMDLVMARLPEGGTPPFVASGVLTDRPPADAPERLATVVHYLAGGLTGPLFVWFTFVTAAVVEGAVATAVVSGVVLYVLMVGFFAVVVLPRSLVSAARVGAIRRDWAVSAAAYLLVLVPVVTVATAAV
jgi:hypothetical protein